LLLAAGAVLVVGSIPYLVAASGILRERCWAAMLLIVCVTLQGAAEALFVLKTILFVALATGGFFRRGAGGAALWPVFKYYAILGGHVMFVGFTLWEALRIYIAERRRAEPQGFTVVASGPRRASTGSQPVPVIPIAPPSARPRNVIPLRPSSQFRADNHYDPLRAYEGPR
jgi:hypothetical protein